MDIFKWLSRQDTKEYLLKCLDSQNTPPFLYLNRNHTETEAGSRSGNMISKSDHIQISNELQGFYRAAGNLNPFVYYSKLQFVLDREKLESWGQEELQRLDILFRLISDRCLYFYEHRRYACSDGGLHILIEREREQRIHEGLNSAVNEVVQELEPLTQTHMDYYHEYLHNYQTLNSALENRKQFVKISVPLLKEVNQLGRKFKVPIENPFQEETAPFIIRRTKAIRDVTQSYIASVIWRTSKSDYREQFLQIFVRKDENAVTTFEKGLTSIVKSITLPDGTLDCLSPYILYNIITCNTKALLQGTPKHFWKNVSRCSKPAAVSSMTELTGRKAGANLALWCELSRSFRGSDSSFDDLFRKLEICFTHPEAKEDMQRQQQDLLDFLFYLTTGYGALYHCQPRHYQVKKLLSEFCKCNVDDNGEEYRLFLYSPDYQHPVDDLGHLIRSNIESCFANRSEFLTPAVYRSQPRIELASLADLILQDMALPAADRLSRLIQKTISENPQILEQYRPCLYEFKESGAVTVCLQEIMDTYFSDLDCLMVRYHDLETGYGFYDHRHVLRAMVEYEIRHQLNKEGIAVLKTIAQQMLPKYLFVTEIFI